MSKKENEAVVNRFLLSSLYYIAGLVLIYGIYKFSQNITGIKLIYEYNMFLWLVGLSVAGLAFSIYKKNVYYIVLTVSLTFCFAVLHFYWPVISSLYTQTSGNMPVILTRSFVPYAGCAVLGTLIYVYECVYYGLNVHSK